MNTNEDIEDCLAAIESIECTIYVKGVQFFKTSITKALYYAFMSYYAFSLEYDKKFKDVWILIEKLFMKWNYSQSTTKAQSICSALSL